MNKIVFDDNELEIALMTFNRPLSVQEWLKKSMQACCDRNISVIVYDASINDDTKNVVDQFRLEFFNIGYRKIPPETPPGYMTMVALENSLTKYVWVVGESRRSEFEELDATLFKGIKNDVNYCVIDIYGERDQIIVGLEELMKKAVCSTTCTGLSVYKNSIFNDFRNDDTWRIKLDQRYRDNYAFAFMGYFYSEFSKEENTAYICSPKVIDINPQEKESGWRKRFYKCWIYDLCKLFENLNISDNLKCSVPQSIWRKMELDNIEYSYLGRKYRDLDKDTYNLYLKNGMLDIVTKKKARICFFAKAPMELVELAYFIYRKYNSLRARLNFIND